MNNIEKIKMYSCQYCGKKYKLKKNHILHEKECSKNPKNKKFTCKYCGKEYKLEKYYKKHEENCLEKNKKNKRSKQKNIRKAVIAKPINLDKQIVITGKKIIFDKKQFIEIAKNSSGSINYMAKVYGVSFATVKKFLDENPDIQEIMKKQQILIIDKASDNLYNAILEGDTDISKWVLTHLKSKYNTDFDEKLKIDNDIKIKIITENNNIIDNL